MTVPQESPSGTLPPAGARLSPGLRLLPVLIAILATLPSLWGDFVFDDALILTGQELRAFDLQRIFWDNYWGDLRFDTNYRPLPLLTYALQFQVSDSAFGFHLVNVLLHGCVSWLAFGVLCRLLRDERYALLGACLYAALAIRVEAVAWLVGRAEILAALAVLGGWWLWLAGRAKGWRGLLLLALITFLGVCAKENAVVLPALLVATAWARHERWPWRAVGACAAAVGVYLLLRSAVLAENFQLLADGRATLVSRVDNPLHHDFVDAGTRVVNAIALHGLYLAKTAVPLSLSADYSFNHLPVRELSDAGLWLRVVATLSILAGGLIFFFKRREPAGLLGVLLFPLGFAVSGNFLFGVGTIFGERLAYLPSLGFALVLAAWAARLHHEQKAGARAFGFFIVLLSAANVACSAVRAWEWRDPNVLNEVTLKRAPDSVRAQLLGASAALQSALEATDPGERERAFGLALERARRASEILPEYPRGHARTGVILLERAQRGGGLDDYADAEQAFTRAIDAMRATGHSDPEPFFQRGLARVGQVRSTPAGAAERSTLAQVLEGAHADFDTFVRALEARRAGGGGSGPVAMHFYYRGLAAGMLADVAPNASAGARAERISAAQADFERALQLDPNQPDVLMQSGSLLSRTGDLEGARRRFERGVELCRELGRDFHPAAVSAWSFARELARVCDAAGDAAAADAARALAASLRGSRGPRGASVPRD